MKILEIRMINCQSHEDTTYSFGSGLNVLIGEGTSNNKGKSVYFKMLKASASPNKYSRKERKSLIRKGAEFARIIFLFEDRSAGMVDVYPEHIRYHYTVDISEPNFVSSLYPDPEFLRRLSVLYMEDSDFFPNIITSSQDLMLVDTNNSTNNNLVSLISNDERLDRVISTSKEKEAYYLEKANRMASILWSLEAQVEGMAAVNLTSLRQSEELLTSAVNVLECLVEISTVTCRIGPIIKSEIDYDNLLLLTDTYLSLMAYSSYVHMGILVDIMPLLHNFPVIEVPAIQSNLSEETFKILEEFIQLSDRAMIAIPIKTSQTLLEDLSLFEKIEQTFTLFVKSQKIFLEFKDTQEAISHMEKELQLFGESVPCVIYGEVKHVQGHCIPIDNRYSLS